MCACSGSNYGSHVGATERDKFVYKETITQVHTPATYNHFPAQALMLAVSSSSLMQHLRRRAGQSLQNLMKDEIAAFHLSRNPGVDSLTGVVPVVQLI